MSISELIRIDTNGRVDPQATLWQTQFNEHVPGLSFESPAHVLGGELLAFHFSGAKLYYFHSEAQEITRQRPCPRNRFAPMIIVPLAGEMVVSQFGRHNRMGPGQFILLDAGSPLHLAYPSEFRHLNLLLPASCFVPAVFHQAVVANNFVSSKFDETFVSLIASIWQGAPSLDAQDHGAALNSILSLMQLTTPLREATDTPVPCVRVRRAMAYIENNLSAEWLTPQMIADDQGVSRRYLDELFGKIGLRIERWIWERRLFRAHEELQISARSRKGYGKSILQIALDTGFKSPSHFSRAFSARFGMPPREYRQNVTSSACALH